MWHFLKTWTQARKQSEKPPVARRTTLAVEHLEGRRVMSTLAVSVYRDPLITWIDQNLQDPGVRAVVRQLDADRMLSRTDMFSVFQQVRADGCVSSTEFTDLKTVVGNAGRLGIPDDVRVLTNKLVNGDRANARYRGASLGNLQAGSTATHLLNLEHKWFRGLDRPAPTSPNFSYRFVSGTLFGGGVSHQDVNQGALADCWYVAVLKEAALKTPAVIHNMFIDNGDNTYTVRFFKNTGTVDYVTVDRYLPTNASGNLVYANQGNAHNDATQKLWVALAEKAYAQLNESGWIGRNDTNTYSGLDWGWPHLPLGHVTGMTVGFFTMRPSSATTMGSAIGADFNSGRMVVFCSRASGVSSNIVASHCYAMLGYHAASDTFTLGNPWGPSEPLVTQTSYQLFQNFSNWAETNPSSTVIGLDTLLHSTRIITPNFEDFDTYLPVIDVEFPMVGAGLDFTEGFVTVNSGPVRTPQVDAAVSERDEAFVLMSGMTLGTSSDEIPAGVSLGMPEVWEHPSAQASLWLELANLR